MKNSLLAILMLSSLITGCASTYTKTSDHCLTYSISGDTNQDWAPMEFYQDLGNNKLYIQLPKYITFVPIVKVVDTEYDQPYKIDYKYDTFKHQIEVQDNYDEYILTRNSYDELFPDNIYLKCNRSMKVKKKE